MSSTNGRSDWFDPRLTVFIIWGIFVVLFVCIPSKRFVQRLCYLMGCSRCGYEEGIAPANNHNGGREMNYEILSNARKQEIDSLRASHLTYRLHPFSLTIEKKHMINATSEEGEGADNSNGTSQTNCNSNKSMPQDRISVLAEQSDPNCNPDDIETGRARGIDPPEGDDCEKEENKVEEGDGGENDNQYTHVSVPLPGNNFDCVDVLELLAAQEEEKTTEKKEKKTKIRLFGGKSSKQQDSEVKGEKEDPNATTTTDSKEHNKGGRRRSCPIFCAICLAEYEISERVSWSSNPECTHVFHEDCVVEWLVSLGRTKSKNHRFSEEPNEAQLLNYQLECPCCRQEFISRGRCDLPDICGEENV